jgi:hypothetical protein
MTSHWSRKQAATPNKGPASHLIDKQRYRYDQMPDKSISWSQMAKASATLLSKLAAAAIMGFAVTVHAPLSAAAESPNASGGLRDPAGFGSISDTAERSRAIFTEIGKLLTHPRCMNCHPAADRPLQGADHHEHMPPVWRGEHGHLATNCSACHTEHNFTLNEAASYKSIPGHPRSGSAAEVASKIERLGMARGCRVHEFPRRPLLHPTPAPK